MSKKPSARTPAARPPQQPPPSGSAQGRQSKTLLVVASVIVIAVAIGVFAYVRGSGPAPSSDPAASRSEPAQAAAVDPATLPPPPPVARQPHHQDRLPPLKFPGDPLPRPADAVRAAYQFAAEHPEILSYVPCFCGCERAGHKGNEDCFVAARAANGDVVEWEDHGMECAVCLDVAHEAMQMYASGASARDIRAAIERKWKPSFPATHTPTPLPPQ